MKNAFHKRNYNVSYKASSPKHVESVMRKQLQKMLDSAKKTKESRNLLAPFSHLKESLLTRSTEMKPQYARQVSLDTSYASNEDISNDVIHPPTRINKSINNKNDHYEEEESICIFDDLVQDCCDFVENKDILDGEEYYFDSKCFNDASHEYVCANRTTYSSSQVQPGHRGKRRSEDSSSSSTKSLRDYLLGETKQRHAHEFKQHLQGTYHSNTHMSLETDQQCNTSPSDSCVLLYYYDDQTNNVRTYNEHHTTRSEPFNVSSFSY